MPEVRLRVSVRNFYLLIKSRKNEGDPVSSSANPRTRVGDVPFVRIHTPATLASSYSKSRKNIKVESSLGIRLSRVELIRKSHSVK